MRQHEVVNLPVDPFRHPLRECAIETERHVAAAGWDQPPRLFALVPTGRLLAAEPHLRGQLPEPEHDALSAIEQEGLPRTSDLDALLGRLAWPDEVTGVALAVERVVVPPAAEEGLPQDPDAASEVLAGHPDRADVRLLAAVLRDGERICLLRQRAHDGDNQVAVGENLAPALLDALAQTLLPE